MAFDRTISEKTIGERNPDWIITQETLRNASKADSPRRVRAVMARRGMDLVRLTGRGVGSETHAGLVRSAEAADARVVAVAWADRALTVLVEPPEDRAPLLDALGRLGTVDHHPDQAVVSCYGAGSRAATLLGEATGGNGWFFPAGDPGALRVVVPAGLADGVVQRVHDGLFERRTVGRRPAA